jgi:ribosomal protein S18 acetylase RimI-like enzyme
MGRVLREVAGVRVIRIYEKTGFKVEGRIKDTYYGEDETYHGTLMMEIILDEELT